MIIQAGSDSAEHEQPVDPVLSGGTDQSNRRYALLQNAAPVSGPVSMSDKLVAEAVGSALVGRKSCQSYGRFWCGVRLRRCSGLYCVEALPHSRTNPA